jgi:hypothetical protein
MRLRSYSVCSVVLVMVVMASACSSGEPSAGFNDNGEALGEATQALVQQMEMSIAVPVAVDHRTVAVASSKTLLLGDRSQLLKPSGGFADSSSVGSVKAHYGFDTKVGSITSAGAVAVLNRATVNGSIRAGGAVTFGIDGSPTPGPAGVTVTGEIAQNSSVPTRTLKWKVPFDLNTSNNRLISSGSVALAPGSYGSLNIQGGTVTLQAGTYYIDSITLETNATISVNSTNGPVYIYVRSAFIFHGNWTATNPENVLLGYFGQNLLALERPFSGTAVAPNARIRLAVGGTPHSGAVLGLETELDPDVKLTFRPFSKWDVLIPDLAVDADCDGAPDALELAAGLSPTNPDDARLDTDADGIPAKEELIFGGNPKAKDSDGDTIADNPDLIAGTDLDGDGKRHSVDNCPSDGNPGQQDADGDGVGDVCDRTPAGAEATALTTLSLYRSSTGDAALAPTGNFDTRRIRTDLKGLVPTDVTVLGFEAPFGAARKVTELWHPSGSHVYAVTAAEKTSFIAAGYREVGALGYFPVTPPALGVPVQIRRFAKTISGRASHAFAISAAGAAALTAEGFVEIAALGYGLTNQGELGRSTLVIRYKDAVGHYKYRFSALGETSSAGWTSDGRQFRLFARPSQWTVALYRLTNGAGLEALTQANEVAAFQSQGFTLRGILGYVYPVGGNVETIEPTVYLSRVAGTGKETVYTANSSEVTTLLASGYTTATPIARVVALRGLDRYRNGQSCTGAKSMDARLRDYFTGNSSNEIASKTLLGLASACTIQRITGSNVTLTAAEQVAKTRLASLDPLHVQTARTEAGRILSLTTTQRAGLLGPVKTLDPGSCDAAIDWPRLGGAVRTLQNSLPGNTNGGTTGGADPKSLVKLRAPQCQGAVTYAAGDRAKPGEAARAVTAAEVGTKTCSGEFCQTPTIGDIEPTVYGIIAGGRGMPAGGATSQWGTVHPEVGVPVAGIREGGSCTTSCSAALGQACVNGACRSYPVVTNHNVIRITGSNFWDLKTARVRLIRASNNEIVSESEVLGYQVKPLQSNTELPARCDFAPVPQSGNLGVPNGPPAGCAPPCLDLIDRSVGPNEGFVEQMDVFVSVPDAKANEFYTVQVVNFNGSYIPRGESVPFDLKDLATQGRSVHVCTQPACTPPPSTSSAACSVIGMPGCGGAVGGTWVSPPRSLSECTALRDASGDPLFSCPETPFTFASGVTAADGTPLRIFIGTDQPQFVQTRLSKVHCNDETGWDEIGKDELVVSFGGAAIPTLAVGDLETSAGVYTTSINRGNDRFPENKFPAVRSDLTDSAKAGFLLQAGEDDDIGARMILATVVTAVVAGAGSYASGGALPAILLASGGGGLTGLLGSYAASDKPFFDPDDFIGRDGWLASSNDVALLGTLSHSAPLDPISAMPATADRRDLSYRDGGKHPSVDGSGYNSNPDVLACTTSSQCIGDRPVCFVGACVQSTWTDKSLPVPFNSSTDAAGTIEHMRMNGDADYEFWVSSSVTGSQQ